MNQRIDDQLFDRRLAAWFADDAGARSPEYLGEVLQRLDGVGQRRAWASLERWLPMTVITSRAPGAPWRLAWIALVLGLVSLIAASALIVGSLVDRPSETDPTLQGLVPTLQLEETWEGNPPSSPTARLDEPMVGGVDADGNLYLVNGGTNHVLALDPSGRLVKRSWVIPVTGTSDDEFAHPRDVAVDAAGNVYVTHTGVQVFSPDDGRLLSEWVPPVEPTEVGIGPIHVATGPDDTVYVSLQMFDTIYKLRTVMAPDLPVASDAPPG